MSILSSPAAAAGAKLFVSQGCAACHQVGSSQIAPDLTAISHSTQTLTDESKVVVDEIYLRESIRQPQLKIVKGYAAAMPPFAHLSDEQVEQLVAYLKTL